MFAATCTDPTCETDVEAKQTGGRFTGKNVLVAGGYGGIGNAMAERVVAEGGQVLPNGTNSEKLNAVKAGLPDAITLTNDAKSTDSSRAKHPKRAARRETKLNQLNWSFNDKSNWKGTKR